MYMCVYNFLKRNFTYNFFTLFGGYQNRRFLKKALLKEMMFNPFELLTPNFYSFISA